MYRPFSEFRAVGNCISVIGSGGKTTLLRHLSERLPGTVILTTSTHIYPFPGIPLIQAETEGEVRAALRRSRVICMGRPQSSGKLAAPALPFEAMLSASDYVIVEADGAAGRPLKAHRPWEPVIPACSTTIVCMVGAAGIGRPATEVCHCAELFCTLAETSPDEPVQIEHIARVINRESLADCCIVNQVDALPDPCAARQLCDLIRADAFPCALAPR